MTPGTARTTASMQFLSSKLLTAPCNVTTTEQELTLIRERLPRAPRTSWASWASLAASGATLSTRAELGHESEASVAHPALVKRLFELCLTGEPYLAGRGSLDQGDQILSLRRGEALRVALPLEEPHAPGEGDKEAARLGAWDLPLPPIHRERGLVVHVPQGLLQADRILATGA